MYKKKPPKIGGPPSDITNRINGAYLQRLKVRPAEEVLRTFKFLPAVEQVLVVKRPVFPLIFDLPTDAPCPFERL